MLEKSFFGLFKMLNESCLQFHRVKRIEHTLYKRVHFAYFSQYPYLRVSPASDEKDAQAMYDVRGMPLDTSGHSYSFLSFVQGRANSKYDEILKLREAIEFVITDHLELVEAQVVTLKNYIVYCGLTFEDMIFELKRSIFEKNLQSHYTEEEEEEER